MKHMLHFPAVAALLFAGLCEGAEVCDVVVYGGTPGGVTAAISAAREGLSVVLLEQTKHVGGMSTSGLNRDEVEHMNRKTMGGLSEKFFNEAARRSTTPPKSEGYITPGSRVWQSHIAEKVFLEMLDAAKVPVRFEQLLQGVSKEAGNITALTVRGGTVYKAKVFIDATYEGDLMAAAGVSYALGREARDAYGESLGGVRYLDQKIKGSPYDEQGNLLPGIMPGPPPAEFSASPHPICYNIRLNLSKRAENSAPIEKPPTYDPKQYELMARSLSSGWLKKPGQVLGFYGLPGGKMECNNSQYSIVSMSMPGEQTAWAEASFEEREAIHKKYRDYTHGLLWFLKSDPRVPENIRDEMAGYGFCKDEWADNGHWPYYLYIRAARRMKSDFIMTQKDITTNRDKQDVIHIGSHFIDSHHVARYAVDKDHFINEGRIWEEGKNFDIPYKVITPKVEESRNLLVPVCVSSSAVAFCAIRLEPTWMHLGEISGMAASLAIRDKVDIQKIDIKELQEKIVKTGIPLEAPETPQDAAGQVTDVEPPRVVMGGEAGNAASACAARFRFAPFDSLPWLRADLTGEKVTESDEKWGSIMRRPFKQYSGDISGRYLEIMAMDSHGDVNVHPALKSMLEEVSKNQRPGGYFCASGTIDWQQPIDYVNERSPGSGGRMLPALWGNSRMLCGLVESMRAFPDRAGVTTAARQLGDFYIAMLPRFNDPARIDEYTSAGSYAAGHVTCWFPAMEGLVKLGTLTGERKYIDAAKQMAAFYERFDHLPIDHAHGMLCCQVSLLLLFEATKDSSYLERVEKRWDELVTGGYINPAGGILEKCHVSYAKDEGCGIADWLRLNLALGEVTGKPRYWAMAERTLHNHFLQNQNGKGGFGHRNMQTDEHGVCGFDHRVQESTWCCSFHGELGFIQLRKHLVSLTDGMLACRFAMDFSATDTAGTITSLLRDGGKPGEVVRQRISMAGRPAVRVRVRMPHWADKVTAVDANGKPMTTDSRDGWCATAQPVNEVEFVYFGAVYAEDRHCTRLPNGPETGKAFVLGYGPKLLVVEGQDAKAPAWPIAPAGFDSIGLKPLQSTFRDQDCRFVFGLSE